MYSFHCACQLFSLIITLILLLIAAIFEYVREFCTKSILGGISSKNESDHLQIIDSNTRDMNNARGYNEGKLSMSDMQQLIDRLTAHLDKKLKAEFAQYFPQVYSAINLPVVVTLDDIKNKLHYVDGVRIFRTSTHIGQRKLFLSELQFLTGTTQSGQQSMICVYAGAAPSNHTGYLSSLFPNVKFILVDPNPFDVFEAKPIVLQSSNDPPVDDLRAKELIQKALDGRDRIYIINDLFTINIARAIAELIPEVYFISDIRTNVGVGEDKPDVTDILWNLSQQYNWMKIMNPKMSMLKFRHPFYQEDPAIFARKVNEQPYKADFDMSKEFGLDFAENYKTKKLVYWDGTINIQAFPGPSSTETRLITDAKSLRDWGTHYDYEDRLFYYNNIERCYGHHVNDNADPKLGFDHCNDCALENLLWKNYISSIIGDQRTRPTVQSFVSKLSKITHRHLIRENHGRFFGAKYPLQRLLRVAEQHAANPRNKYNLYDNNNNNKWHR